MIATRNPSAISTLGGSRETSQRCLLERIGGGDKAAFAEFYDRVAEAMMSVACRILGEAEAEEAVQESFLAIWKHAGTFNPELNTPLGWSLRLTRNKCIDRLRVRGRRSRMFDDTIDPAVLHATADSGPVDPGDDPCALRSELREVLQTLPLEQRRVLDLAFFGGLTQQEIASHLSLPLGTVKARIRRGVLRLRLPIERLKLESR